MSILTSGQFSIFSWVFVVAFIALFVVYWLAPRKLRHPLLLLGSLAFYGAWDLRLLGLMVAAALANHFFLTRVAPGPGAQDEVRRRVRKNWLRLGLTLQVGLLFVFKYFGFFMENLAAVIPGDPEGNMVHGWQLLAPLGLSYFCLKAISILVDGYRGQLGRLPSAGRHLTYLLFFASITAGPIDRAKNFLGQLDHLGQKPFLPTVGHGLDLLVVGCLKKLVIANNLAPAVERAFASDFPDLPSAMLAATTYAFYLYADFSGYSDLARGLAACLGIDLMVNFRSPYWARSTSEFWQRWHISLSTWLRDYLFLPLGGAFRSRERAYANLLITMFIAGLWHGASWLFVLWGVYIGVLLVLHRMLQRNLKKLRRKIRLRYLTRRVVERVLTFTLVSYGWLFFNGKSLSQALSGFTGRSDAAGMEWRPILEVMIPLGLLCLVLDRFADEKGEPVFLGQPRLPWWGKTILATGAVYAIFFLGAEMRSFVYAQF